MLKEQSDSRNRERIALGVLLASIIAVFSISVVVIATAENGEKRGVVSGRVMDSTLPLYGTWVGTILAFYFSRNAFEAASRATDRTTAAVLQQANSGLVSAPPLPDNRLAKIPLKALANDLVFSQDDMNKPLQDVVNELESRNRYRVIVVDADKKYVNMVYRINASAFLVQSQPEGSNPQRDQGGDPVSPPPTLKNYLDWRHEQGEKAQPIVIFLSESATLADADAKIKETIGCRDAIVTTDGKDTSPVVIYVTDTDINEYKQ
ncbi:MULTISPECIES: hypothetical protein [unclassified Microcoleus]|uniref:hypothetical protein n=2 Tax=Microcoleus TaxID=44471 RepID=UPI002FD00A4F